MHTRRNLSRRRVWPFTAAIVVISILVLAHRASTQDTLPTTSGGITSGTNRNLTTQQGADDPNKIEINVWGFVRNPGKFYVSPSARLLDVVSLAGGPTDRAQLEKVKVVHDRHVDSSHKELVVLIDLEKFQETGDPTANPVLYPGDTIIIPGDSLNTFNQVVSIVSSISVVTLSVIGLIFAFKKN